MKVNIQQNEKEVVVSLSGEMDTVATTNMNDALTRVNNLASQRIVVDCKELEYISSYGLRFFMQLKRSSEQQGGSIDIINLNDDVKDIFHLSGFHHIFNIDSTEKNK